MFSRRAVAGFFASTVLLGAGATTSFGAVTEPCFGRKPTIVGTSNADNIVGTNGSDVIFSGDGDDKVSGRGGADRICAGQGDDVVEGGLDDDTIFGSTGVDKLVGGDGDDKLYSGGSNSSDFEQLLGGTGDDDLRGESTPEEIHGGLGADRIVGGSSLLNVPDQLFGDADDDRLMGPDAVLHGGQGDDFLFEGTISFALALGPVRVDLENGVVVGEGDDRVDSVVHAIGSRFDDVLVGTKGDNRLVGDEGNDLLDGGGGSDVLDGGAGEDGCVERGTGESFASCESIGDSTALGLNSGLELTQPRLVTAEDPQTQTWLWVGAGLVVLALIGLAMYRIGVRRAASATSVVGPSTSEEKG
ncbi:MAG: calcium-binding protein [Actinomycetota bacterium]